MYWVAGTLVLSVPVTTGVGVVVGRQQQDALSGLEAAGAIISLPLLTLAAATAARTKAEVSIYP